MSAATETPPLEREELRMVLHNAIVLYGADLWHELMPGGAGMGGSNHLGRLLRLIHFCHQAELQGTLGDPCGLDEEVDASGDGLYELVRPWRENCLMFERDWYGPDSEEPGASESAAYWQSQREAAERVLDAVSLGWRKVPAMATDEEHS